MIKISKDDLREFNKIISEYLINSEVGITIKRNTSLAIKEVTDFVGQGVKDVKAKAKRGLAGFDLDQIVKINKVYKKATFLEYVINGLDFKVCRDMKGINYNWEEKVKLLIYSLEIMEEMNKKAE